MALNIDNNYRVKRSAEQEEAMRYLINDLKVFQSYSQILVISALIGYSNKTKNPIKKTASDGVLMQFFDEKNYDIMNLLAYADQQVQSILTSQGVEKYNIFESYANGGFPILVEKLEIDLVDRTKNNRLEILRRYYTMLLTKDIIIN